MSKKIIIEVGHPNDVHQFKYLFKELTDSGCEILFLAKQKDIVIELLEAYKLPYHLIGKTPEDTLGKIISLFKFTSIYFKKALEFKPDLIISRNSPHSAWVGFLLNKTHLGFMDTENTGFLDRISVPFIKYVFSSTSYRKEFGKKHFKYPGYIESWYLHPKRYVPNPKVIDLLGVKPQEKFFILRFVSWQAHHDKGITGLSDDFKIKLVEQLLPFGKVFISSEKKLPSELESYRFKLPPELMHDALYYASLFYGESATMSSECAHLGTPAIYLDPIGRGYTDEQGNKYRLIHNFKLDFDSSNKSLKKAVEIVSKPDYLFTYNSNHKKFLSDIIDPAAYIKWFILNLPKSTSIIEADRDYWKHFISSEH